MHRVVEKYKKKKKEIRDERASVPSHNPSDRSKITTTSDRKYIVSNNYNSTLKSTRIN